MDPARKIGQVPPIDAEARRIHAAGMSFTATVENGTITLPPDVHLPDGTEVTVEPSKPAHPLEASEQSVSEGYEEFIGCLRGAPSDLADNLDHYLYGRPKREV